MIQKKSFAVVLVAALLSIVALPATATPVEGGEQVVLHVEGMTCGGCASRLERVLTRIEGVEKATADHEKGRVELTLSAKVADAELKRRITKAGFELTRVERP